MGARQHAALAELSRAALADTEIPLLIQQAVTLVAQALAVEHSAIWELLPDTRALLLRTSVGWQGAPVGQVTVGAGTASPVGYALLCDAPLVVADWSRETRCEEPSILHDLGATSGLYVVIHGQMAPFGCLSVESVEQRTFANEEVAFLQTVANLLALTIERVQLHQSQEQRVAAAIGAARLAATAQAQAVQEERQRLARDLHDSVTQSLYGVTLHAEAATRLLAAGDLATVAEYLRDVQDTAQEALEEMRLLIFELRPSILEHAGLAAALQARLDAVEGRAKVKTNLVIEGVNQLPTVVEQALYRIAQEALNNALKHAHAQHITVQLRQVPSGALLEVADDGVGFEPTIAHERGGMGLRGIAERVAQLRGHIDLAKRIGSWNQSAGGDSAMTKPIRVLIVDDHLIVRKGIHALLATEPDIEVVGEACDGGEAICEAARLQPDVILMDLVMPQLDGIAATQRIIAGRPTARVLVLTSFDSDDKVFPAIRAGALGYTLKDAGPTELVQAIRRVHEGESSLHPTIARKVLQELAHPPQHPPTSDPLTEREVEVLRLLAHGESNQQIAAALNISEGTVRTHVSNILSKLHLASRTQAALYALREGLASLDSRGQVAPP